MNRAECRSGLHIPMSRLGQFEMVGPIVSPEKKRQANAGREYMVASGFESPVPKGSGRNSRQNLSLPRL